MGTGDIRSHSSTSVVIVQFICRTVATDNQFHMDVINNYAICNLFYESDTLHYPDEAQPLQHKK